MSVAVVPDNFRYCLVRRDCRRVDRQVSAGSPLYIHHPGVAHHHHEPGGDPAYAD